MTYRSLEDINRENEFAENRITFLKEELVDIYNAIKALDSECRKKRSEMAKKLGQDVNAKLHFTALSFSPTYGRKKTSVYVYIRIYFTKSDMARSRQIPKGRSGKGYSENKIRKLVEDWELDIVMETYREIRLLEKLAATYTGNIKSYQDAINLKQERLALIHRKEEA